MNDWSMDLETQTRESQQPFASSEMRTDTTATTTSLPLACNIGSLLSFSCRSRAESFARKLQLKLKTLGTNGAEDSILMESNSVTPSAFTWATGSVPDTDILASELGMEFQSFAYQNNNNSPLVVTATVAPMRSTSPVNGVDSIDSAAMPFRQQSSDSDVYFDFDIGPGSPGSPVEGSHCFTLINPCDDLYCQDCLIASQTGQRCLKKHDIGTGTDQGFESGCVFSSPASSTSPDGYATTNVTSTDTTTVGYNGNSSFDDTLTPKANTNGFTYSIHSPTFTCNSEEDTFHSLSDSTNEPEDVHNVMDVGDCSSDASDSVYYDVDSSFSSSSSCSSPKVTEDYAADNNEETTTQKYGSTKQHYEALLFGVQNISLDSNQFPRGISQHAESNTTATSVNEIPALNLCPVPQMQNSLLTTSQVEKSGVDSTKLSHNMQLLCPISSDDDDDERPRIQRCSSLKTGKTPPGTPGRKKIVRFADVLGLDLADVRTFLDEIPNVPKSAFRDLEYCMETSNASATKAAATAQRRSSGDGKTLVPSFHQPVSTPDFFDRIRDQKILLENAYLSDNFTIKGTVRVMNMDFHKSVYIRRTCDDWKTFTDFQATYVSGSCDGFSDKFEFTMTLNPDMLEIGNRLTFACRFHCQGQQFWDNNSGRNYIFHCVPASSQTQQNLYDLHSFSPSTDDPWMTHMW